MNSNDNQKNDKQQSLKESYNQGSWGENGHTTEERGATTQKTE